MPVTFIGSETSTINIVSAVEGTTASTYRSANSRGSIAASNNTMSAWAEWKTAVSEGWVHFVMQGSLDNDDSDNVLIVTDNSSGNLFRLRTSGIATLQSQYWAGGVWNNAGTAFAVSSSTNELVVHLIAGGSGSFEVYQAGALKDSGSAAFSGTDMKRATFYCPDESLAQYYSEVMLGDDDISLVASVVETEAPTATSTDTDGTGAYTDIDEAVVNDADVLTLASAGEHHSFTSPARTSTLLTVLGVSVGARMKRDVGGPQSAKFYVKIGGTRYYGDTFALTAGFVAYQYTWAQNPATAADWTTTDANASTLEWGIEAVA